MLTTGSLERDDASKPLLVAVGLTSLAILMLEVLLTRVVSVMFFPIGVYFVFSLALLGIGAAGAVLSITFDRLQRWRSRPQTIALVGFSISCLLDLIWITNARLSVASFIALSFALAVPFFWSGYAIAFAYGQAARHATRIYLVDLAGAGIGAVLAVVSISLTDAETAIGLAAVVGGIAACASAWDEGARARAGMAACLVVVLLAAASLPRVARVPALPPKELGVFDQRYPQLQAEYQRWGPVARVDVVSLPGDRIELPQPFEYKFVTQDGSAPSIILNLGDVHTADFADHTLLGIPYWIKSKPDVLIIGLGGGPDVQAALRYEARSVVGIEINAAMIDIVENVFGDFAGRPYDDPRVQVILGDGRHTIASMQDRFDIIQLTGVDTAVASFGASPNLAENYLYTIEAVQDYWRHLKSDGVLSISFPNVGGIGARLFGLVLDALERSGEQDLGRRLLVSHTGGFVHVLAKKTPFSAGEVRNITAHFDSSMRGIYYPLFHRLLNLIPATLFAENRIVFAPGLDQPSVYGALYTARQEGRFEAWLASQPEDLSAPVDDRPFFFIRDKWFGYMPSLGILLGLVALLLVFALLFILLPLAAFRRRGARSEGNARLVAYFACLGLGYLFVEVFLIQKLTLFLGHPAFSIPTVLGGLLIASGLGGGWSARLAWPARRKVQLAVAAVVVMIALQLIAVQPLLLVWLDQTLAARVAIALLIIAPLGFVMGIPFPTVLRTLDQRVSGTVAWAWGVNGIASVVASVLAMLVAVTWGYRVLALVAGGLYLLAVASLRPRENDATPVS